jgi:hypothetical protein
MSEAPVMFGTVRILASTSFRVARPPELLDETIVFSIRFKQEKHPLLFGSDDVSNILVHPSFIDRVEVRLRWVA